VHLVACEAAVAEGQTLFHQCYDTLNILLALIVLCLSGLVRGAFDDGEQLSLQGAMIPPSAGFQFYDQLGRCILD
jgi:hypothetical protein